MYPTIELAATPFVYVFLASNQSNGSGKESKKVS